MINRYFEKSVETEVHSAPHKLVTYDDGSQESICECDSVTTVQALYDFVDSHRVRICADRNNTFRSDPIWLTPNQARQLASQLCFAANDADTLNAEFPID